MAIYLKLGTVSSGKSSKLINEVYSYTSKDRKVIVCKSDEDIRNVGYIESRSGQKPIPCETLSEENNLSRIMCKYGKVDAIFIDEVQLLNKQQCEDVINAAVNIPILCYGLKSDYTGKMFESISTLSVYAKDEEEIISICSHCNSRAKMNMRLVDGKGIFEGDSIIIDKNLSESEYVAVCPRCYMLEKYL